MEDQVVALRTKKEAFLNSLQRDIKQYIIGKGSECIAIIEKNKDGTTYCTWHSELDIDFCKVLFHFVRKKTYHNHDLDSALTEPICKLVTDSYESFYKDHEEEISASCLAALLADDLIRDSFLGRLMDVALEKSSATIRKKVVHEVVNQVHGSASNGLLNHIGHQVGTLASTTAGSQIAAVIGHVFIKLLAAHLGAVVAEVLASAAFHKLLAIIVKKMIFAAVGAAILNFLVVHVGAAVSGSTLMWIVAPLLLAYLAYAITTFPEKLGEEVSKSVRKELSSRFDDINRQILKSVFDEVLNGEKLVSDIAGDKEFQKLAKDLAAKV